nr:hypothetical protein [Candidatus Sigynarchaeota archaeon]
MTQDEHKISMKCPTCGREQSIIIPAAIMAKQHTGICTVQISAACGHHFDVFVDQKYAIRGFHRPDFVIISELAEVDRKLSTLAKTGGNIDNQKNPDILVKNLKNFIDGDGFFEEFFKNKSSIDIYSKTKILGVAQGKSPEIPAVVVAASSATPGKLEAKEKQVMLEEIKKQYELRIQKLTELMKTQATMTDADKSKLAEIKKDLDEFQKKIFKA